MPHLHPRHREVQHAALTLNEGLLDIEQRYNLTEAEMLTILVDLLSSITRGMLREERYSEIALPLQIEYPDEG